MFSAITELQDVLKKLPVLTAQYQVSPNYCDAAGYNWILEIIPRNGQSDNPVRCDQVNEADEDVSHKNN